MCTNVHCSGGGAVAVVLWRWCCGGGAVVVVLEVVMEGPMGASAPPPFASPVPTTRPVPTVPHGPSWQGKFKGKDIGSGTSVWEFSEKVRAGEMSEKDFAEAEACMSRSRGTCMTMGTASTMACVAESLGLTLPNSASIPAVDARRNRIAQMSGACHALPHPKRHARRARARAPASCPLSAARG